MKGFMVDFMTFQPVCIIPNINETYLITCCKFEITVLQNFLCVLPKIQKSYPLTWRPIIKKIINEHERVRRQNPTQFQLKSQNN